MNNYQTKKELTKEDVLKFANINGYDLIAKIKEEQARLTKLFEISGMAEEEFYRRVMVDYAKEISRFILEDYGSVLDLDTISKLEKFITTNEAIVFLDKKDFPEIDGETTVAFARHEDGIVCFPSYNGKDDIIEFIRKQEQSLVHEIFHIVTRNYSNRADFMYNGENIGKYTPGKIFNEAMAEKSARDFATRHNLMYHPMVSYMPYVINLENFMNKYGIHENSQLFNVNFREAIQNATPEEQQQYHDFERDYYLRRFGKTDDLGYQNEPATSLKQK